ncbi:coiled-coil domain-containing protein 175 [Tachyglossus aculeatus]|uniref:coiled-coil domain-containing protein 175 n=1 Tax=Tachyglossus aculeatus TaxID=9261 RepID=UPI0018F6178E|nr:coiled-coil domain-containing protein 175 [Tachyglossus aculeatus]
MGTAAPFACRRPAAMELSCSAPGLGASVAVEALKRLLGVEKTLKNKEFVFNHEVKKFLEETARAVKELETMRKTTVDLLEIETIEISKLRFVLLNLPGNIAKELEDAVKAAHVDRDEQTRKLQAMMGSTTGQLELLTSKQTDVKIQNCSLNKEQGQLTREHQDTIQRLNQKMEEKARANIFINQIYTQKRDEEEEMALQKILIADVEAALEEEKEIFRKEKGKLDKEGSEMKKWFDERQVVTLKTKEKLDILMVQLKSLEKIIYENKKAIHSGGTRIYELEGTRKRFQSQLEEKMKLIEVFMKKKCDYEAAIAKLSETSQREKEKLLMKIKKVEEKLINSKQSHRKLEERNRTLRDQSEAIRREEEELKAKKQVVLEIYKETGDGLSSKQDFLAKRRLDIQNLEKDIEKLEGLYLSTVDSYDKQLELLRETLEREIQRWVIISWKIAIRLKRHTRWVEKEEKVIRDMKRRIQKARIKQVQLHLKSGVRQKENKEFVTMIEVLQSKLEEEEEEFVKVEQQATADIQGLEGTLSQLRFDLQGMESDQEAALPQLSEAQELLEERVKQFEDLRNCIIGLQGEESSLNFLISVTLKEIATFLEKKNQAKAKLSAARAREHAQLLEHTDGLKVLEREIYEMTRKLDHMLMENFRIKIRNEQVLEDLASVRAEGENHVSASEKIHRDLQALHERFLEKWAESRATEKMFSEADRGTLRELRELIQHLCQRAVALERANVILWETGERLDCLVDYGSATEQVSAAS